LSEGISQLGSQIFKKIPSKFLKDPGQSESLFGPNQYCPSLSEKIEAGVW